MPGLPAMSTFRTAPTSGEVKRGYVRTATAVATKSVPSQIESPTVETMEVDVINRDDMARFTPSPPDLGSPMNVQRTASPNETPASSPVLSLYSGSSSSQQSTPGQTLANNSESGSLPGTPGTGHYKPTKQEGDELTRPALSFAGLIAKALHELPGNKGTLAMIYQFIEDKYPFFR